VVFIKLFSEPISVGNLATAYPNDNGDIIIAKVTLQSEATGETSITFSTIPGTVTIYGGSTTEYDPQMSPNTVIINKVDSDQDGIADSSDNCPNHRNPEQEDTMPPGGNSDPAGGFYCGDACECNGDFDPDGDVDVSDAVAFKLDFFRKDCKTVPPPCNGDFECDGDVDGSDAVKFKSDFFRKDCPSCGGWPCGYE